MNNPKRLIEVDLPIKKISLHARREKSIRFGHISTLHIWWARRPLAACRAAICASLWPDPADPECPVAFRVAAGGAITEFAAKVSESLALYKTCSPDSGARWESLTKESWRPDPFEPLHQLRLRSLLLDFIGDFANWDNSATPEYLETAQTLTRASHEALGGMAGALPLVADPFAGGGSMPLEALRVGADAYASDLNPIPLLLNRVAIEYIPRYGERLAEEVRKWGNWVQVQAAAELDGYYPPASDGSFPIGYLWARTILSEAPDVDDVPVEVPLLRSMWLAKASSSDRALRWVRDEQGKVRTQIVEKTFADGTIRTVRQPILEIISPTRTTKVEAGTSARGAATCPVTGYTTPVTSIRAQLHKRRGGAADARLLAVRQGHRRSSERTYRLPEEADFCAITDAVNRLHEDEAASTERWHLTPDEPLPPEGVLGFRVQKYGMAQWRDLFTPRQLLSLAVIGKHLRSAGHQISESVDPNLALAVQSCLALSFGRLTDFSSSLCTLNATGNRGVFHTFARHAIPMVWDFMETVPLNPVGANWLGGVDTLEATIRVLALLPRGGHVGAASALQLPLPDGSVSAFCTDPPYYDAVPYSDLSDYFYVWLKRVLPSGVGFDNLLTPKDEECIVDFSKKKDKKFYEKSMGEAMAEGRRILTANGIGFVVFAHKTTSGWESILQAMIHAGWTITGSWPIDTERPGRLRAMNSAALASSVHLVCRPRFGNAVGEWRDVLTELPKRIHKWMPHLLEEGVVGADAIFACLGPALEVFSRYGQVEKASGESVSLSEYLEHVWSAVAQEALSLVFAKVDANVTGFEPDARLTAIWLWTLNSGIDASNGEPSQEVEEEAEEEDDVPKAIKFAGYVLEFDTARKIAQGLGAHLEQLRSVVELKGNKARLLPLGERAKFLLAKQGVSRPAARTRKRQPSLFDVIQDEAEEATESPLEISQIGQTTLDRLHQAMLLFGASHSESLRRFIVEEGVGRDTRFWKLAQALSALYPPGTEEKRWVDGVLARKKGLGF